MKKDTFKFLRETFKSPFAYLGGFLFVYFSSLTTCLILSDLLWVVKILDPIKFLGIIFTDWISIFLAWSAIILAMFFIWMIIFNWLKNYSKWAWISYFSLLPSKILIITMAIFDFLYELSYGDCGIPMANDRSTKCFSAFDYPHSYIPLVILAIFLFWWYFYLYKKREKFSIKSDIFSYIFLVLISAYVIYLLYYSIFEIAVPKNLRMNG